MLQVQSLTNQKAIEAPEEKRNSEWTPFAYDFTVTEAKPLSCRYFLKLTRHVFNALLSHRQTKFSF
jgi:hypothetical protein